MVPFQLHAVEPSPRLRQRLMSKDVSKAERAFYEVLVLQLRSRREDLGLTQLDLAITIGVSDYLVTKWENLIKIPTAFGLMCWCQALGLTMVASDV